MTALIAHVALNIPVPQLFDYLAGDLTAADIGGLVWVPFGQRQQLGVLVAVNTQSGMALDQLKPVGAKLDDYPTLSGEIFDLLLFCSRYYHYPIGPTLFTAVPTLLRKAKHVALPAPSGFTLSAAGRVAGTNFPARNRVQIDLFTRLQHNDYLTTTQKDGLSAHARKLLREWQQCGWVVACDPPPLTVTARQQPPVLTAEQQHALSTMAAASAHFHVFLLHGVTGSGKTEVYLQLAQRVVSNGGQILVLVPEIKLTSQLTDRFCARFGAEHIALLHSDMGEQRRLLHWQAAQLGRARIVLGTRLALFTPMPKLQLIILDEEHDQAFHQQEGLRYAARDVAVVRAQHRNCPIVLGSATPSLESWWNAHNDRYQLVSLSQRAIAHATLPDIQLIDTRSQKPVEGLTPALDGAIHQCLAQGKQSLIYINRRGYAPALYCRGCGWAAGCPRCSSKLVLHQRDRVLRCHHCGHQQKIVSACPNCGDIDLHPGGFGTQRVEQGLRARFPSARILRVDRDSAGGDTQWQAMQREIHAGRVDILVGTQLLSKGHDFPRLTLVGVVGADETLFSADFRATERLFAQLMQVGGRAGRAESPGKVLIQTGFPQHPLYQALVRHDFSGYAQHMLDERRATGFPPFVHQVALRCEAGALADAIDFLHQAQQCAPIDPQINVFDPTPEAMPRKANRERALLLAQCIHRTHLQRWLAIWLPALSRLRATKVRWRIDVDPQQL